MFPTIQFVRNKIDENAHVTEHRQVASCRVVSLAPGQETLIKVSIRRFFVPLPSLFLYLFLLLLWSFCIVPFQCNPYKNKFHVLNPKTVLASKVFICLSTVLSVGQKHPATPPNHLTRAFSQAGCTGETTGRKVQLIDVT